MYILSILSGILSFLPKKIVSSIFFFFFYMKVNFIATKESKITTKSDRQARKQNYKNKLIKITKIKEKRPPLPEHQL